MANTYVIKLDYRINPSGSISNIYMVTIITTLYVNIEILQLLSVDIIVIQTTSSPNCVNITIL